MSAIYSPLEKRRKLENLLDSGLTGISVNPLVEGVDLPEYLSKETKVDLNLSYAFKLPVFHISNQEVRATLSFNGVKHLCIIPWDSIFYMEAYNKDESLGKGSSYLLDLLCMPKELQAEALVSLGLEESELEDLAWDFEFSDEEFFVDLLDEEEDSSDDDGCVDFSAFLAKKKAEEESK